MCVVFVKRIFFSADIFQKSTKQSVQNGQLDSLMEPVPIEHSGSVARASAEDKAKWEAEG